jgi:hypothetical protein
MKTIVLFVLLQAIWTTGFSENPRWREFGTRIPARADLDVQWNAPTNKLPPSVWTYHLSPRKLSPQVVSNLMAVCSFTEKNTTVNGDLLIFNSHDGKRHLRLSWPWGVVDYDVTTQRSPTNLVKDVPSERQAVKLAKKLLQKLDIDLSDLDKEENSTKPRMICFDGGVTYFVNRQPIKNTEFRAVRFTRAIDGMPFLGAGGTGGDGEIDFGDHGKISKILITWRTLERKDNYPTVPAEMMVNSIREGKAVQGYLPGNVSDIDWPNVKKVTIKRVSPCYYVGGNRLAPSDWLYPFAALDATVDTGHGDIDVEIDCPIIDETKLMKE